MKNTFHLVAMALAMTFGAACSSEGRSSAPVVAARDSAAAEPIPIEEDPGESEEPAVDSGRRDARDDADCECDVAVLVDTGVPDTPEMSGG